MVLQKKFAFCVGIGVVAAYSGNVSCEQHLVVAPAEKICYVNFSEIVKDSKEGQIFNKQLETTYLDLKKGIDDLTTKLDQDKNAYNNKKKNLSAEVCKKEEKKLEIAERERDMRAQKCQEELQKIMNDMFESLSKEMLDVIAAFAEEKGFDAVQDSMTGRVIYAAPRVDATKIIIARADERYNKNSSEKGKQSGTKSPKVMA